MQDPPEIESGDATNGTSTPTNPSANGEGTMTVAWIVVGVLIVLISGTVIATVAVCCIICKHKTNKKEISTDEVHTVLDQELVLRNLQPDTHLSCVM